MEKVIKKLRDAAANMRRENAIMYLPDEGVREDITATCKQISQGGYVCVQDLAEVIQYIADMME